MPAETRDLPAAATAWQPCARDQWDSLIGSAGKSPLEQAWAYGEAVAAQHGQQVERHLITCGGTPAALLQSFHKTYWRLGVTRILRGPLWLIDPLADPRGAEICRGIARRWRRHPTRFLSWLPELPDGPRSAALIEGAGLRRVVTGYSSAWLDLRQDREALLAGLHGKWRAALRRAEREDLTVAEDTRQRQWQAALMLYESFRRKKRFVGLSADFIAALAAADRAAPLSLTARRGGTPVAGVILLRHGASATYTASWTSDEGRAGQAHNLLLWRAVETLKAGGTQWLDLGGLNTESQPGLARFKLGLGGEVFTLTGSYL
ncbi:MAG: GNAT family N-acetyltransferase [Bacteroidota bacterium]|nr:GNAT family N-acetyltransferase [Kiloniellaceae bacterium]